MLREDLEGRVLSHVKLRDYAHAHNLKGQRVTRIETVGKHLLFHFDKRWLLRVHLGMHGSWHRYSRDEAWKRSPGTARVVLGTEQKTVVCFNPMEVELLPQPQRPWHRQLAMLGPDLLSEEEPPWERILERVEEFASAETPLGELLLDQRIACGLGNVYKSELAFMGPLQTNPFSPGRGLSPWTPLARLSPDQVEGLYRRGRALLQNNLGGWWRTTRYRVTPGQSGPKERLYVYGREGRACFSCGTTIERGHQGLQNRVTYWCPSCQPQEPGSRPASG